MTDHEIDLMLLQALGTMLAGWPPAREDGFEAEAYLEANYNITASLFSELATAADNADGGAVERNLVPVQRLVAMLQAKAETINEAAKAAGLAGGEHGD